MKFLLTIYTDESQAAGVAPEDMKAMIDAYDALTGDMREAGVLVAGDGLQPTSTATTVRVRGDERLLTDGPFAETKEQLGGFYMVDVPDIDAAIDWAARIPGARFGSIEVRPVMDYEAAAASAAEGAASAS